MAERFSAAGIVLAAGRSSRMGAHKLLLPLGGRPLVGYAVRAALASRAHPVFVVLGHEAGQVRAALPAGAFQIIENPRYAEGMATSLRAGIAAVPVEATGAIVLLADQPLLRSEHVNRLLAEAKAAPEAIVAASYDGQRGNPVYFPRALFGELLVVEGDEGGRSVIARHPERLQLVALELEAALDVDRPGEYEAMVASWERYSRMGEG
ncbi:MAG TPA: nucleotidyltransferase family protein [Ktedonobacterales bacterium]|nr:nucleotidyltransferase family protein [Ktedonobacterales bacterium]